MKILVICGGGYVYGREIITLSLIRGLRDRGHDVRCATTTWTNGEFEARLDAHQIPRKALALGFISKTLSWSAIRMTADQLVKLPALWLGYSRFLREFQPDAVLHSNFHHAVLLRPLFGGETNVFHAHDAFPATSFYRSLFKWLNRRISAFAGVSKFAAQALVDLELPAEKIHVVANGITKESAASYLNSENGSKPNEGEKTNTEPFRIGIVGQVGDWKGHEDLIDALQILQEKQADVLCRIFGEGDGEFAAKLRSKINEYQLTERVEWMGFVNEKKSIYGQMDVCVVPSRCSEAFGMVAAEASMFGLPVIASRKGGLPEIVLDQQTGYLIDAGSPAQLAERILLLATSPARRSQMGQSATAHISNVFSAGRMVDEMQSLLETLRLQKTVGIDLHKASRELRNN